MSEIEYGLVPDGSEPDSRFETYAKLPSREESRFHHFRISVKQEGGTIGAVCFQPFRSPEGPMQGTGCQIPVTEETISILKRSIEMMEVDHF